MKWFLFLFSVSWIAAGSWYILYTQQARQKAQDIINAMNPKIMAGLAALFGLLLFLSASSSSNSGFIIFIGILSIASRGCQARWYVKRATRLASRHSKLRMN